MNRQLIPVLFFFAACGFEQGADPDRVALGRTHRTDELRRPITDDGIIIGNALSSESLMFSSLITHRTANPALIRNPLSATSFTTVEALRTAMQDPRSIELMHYIVGCALPDATNVTWISSTSVVHTFKGQAGLCPSWASLPPGGIVSDACQQLVSACLLARNNALGRHVPLSVRGDNLVGGSTVQVGNHFTAFDHTVDSAPVDSVLKRCPTPQWGASRNCGWEPGQVHACTPGATVTVAAGAPAASACFTGAPLGAVTSGDMVLRACKGTSSCDYPAVLGQSEGYECPNYLYRPTITFACPPGGFFNVMAAPYASASSGAISLGTAGSSLAVESAGYPVREGNFYGTLFDVAALKYEVVYNPQTGAHPVKSLGGGPVVFSSMYACADDQWIDSDYLATGDARDGRLCALGNCAANNTGRCRLATGAHCTADDTGDGEFRQCAGGGSTWPHGLTTFLRGPCDLTNAARPKLCLRFP
jgi:hypothetical protein